MTIRLGEDHSIFHEQITVSSASSGLTLGYSMENCDQISFICGLGTAAAAATAITPTFTVRQGGDLALSTSTTVGGATAVCGPTTVEQVNNARSVLITFGTAATGAQTVTLNGHVLTYTTSTASFGSTIATALFFGSTVGSTAAEGQELAGNSFSSVVNNSTLIYWMTAATISTAVVRLTAKDTASTGITVLGVVAAYSPTIEKAHSQIDILASDLNSTSKYVALGISTATTSVTCGITVIKSGLRYSPPYQSAQAYKKST